MSLLRLPGLSFFTLLLFSRRRAHTDGHTDGDRAEGFLRARRVSVSCVVSVISHRDPVKGVRSWPELFSASHGADGSELMGRGSWTSSSTQLARGWFGFCTERPVSESPLS